MNNNIKLNLLSSFELQKSKGKRIMIQNMAFLAVESKRKGKLQCKLGPFEYIFETWESKGKKIACAKVDLLSSFKLWKSLLIQN